MEHSRISSAGISPVPIRVGRRAAASRVVALLLATLAALSCSDAAAPGPAGPTLRIVPVADSVFEGDTVRLTAQVFDSAGNEVTGAPVTWTVSNLTLARVIGDGILALEQPGTVRVGARSGTAAGTYDLAIGRLVVQAVELAPDSLDMGRGDRVVVAARVLGQGGRLVTGRTVTFASDNTLVAEILGPGSSGSVDTGLLAATGPGTTTIRASVEGVEGTAQVGVVVADTPFVLTRYNGLPLPVLVAADSVEFNGVMEYDEVYADSGFLVLSGLLQERYQLGVRFSQYHVFQTGNTVQRELRLQIIGEHDNGIVTVNPDASLSLLSELIGPILEHSATLEPDGYLVHYRVPGENFFLDLSYEREQP